MLCSFKLSSYIGVIIILWIASKAAMTSWPIHAFCFNIAMSVLSRPHKGGKYIYIYIYLRRGSKKLTILLLNDFHPIKNIHGGSKRIEWIFSAVKEPAPALK